MWSEQKIEEPSDLVDGVFQSEGAAVEAGLSAAAGHSPQPGVAVDGGGYTVTFAERQLDSVEVYLGGQIDKHATATLHRRLKPAFEAEQHIRDDDLAFFPDANIVIWQDVAYTCKPLYAPASVKRKRTFEGIHKRSLLTPKKICFACT